MNHKKLLRQFMSVLSGRLVSTGLQAISIVFLARWVTPVQLGYCMTLLGVMNTLHSVGDVGATTYITRRVAACGMDTGSITAQRFSLYITSLLGVLALGACVTLSLLEIIDLYSLLPLWGWFAIERAAMVRNAVWMGLGHVTKTTRDLTIRRFLALALFLGFAFGGLDPLFSFAMGSFIGSLIAFMVFRNIPTQIEEIEMSWKTVFQESKHYWVHSFALQARNLDALIVSTLAGPLQAGFYGLGSRLIAPLRMLPTSLSSVVLPWFARPDNTHESPMRLLGGMTAIMAIPYLILIGVMPFAVVPLFGENYAGAVLPLQIICLGLVVSSSTSIASSVLQAKGFGHIVSAISVWSSLYVLALIGVGAYIQGSVGAAMGYSTGSAIHTLVLVVALKRYQ
ncbi:lipopolysaccharide biosynthesis protein [Agitococcus lubricus]|uniref:O-antigen/teichoic acid export membrane protein n=1 Tax=Agitococcus lubricus TaxID=1077255 RepID=A0A2T5J395_9GAMM|nr:lipopolysaccharide biosynthesis protein [Agitococcus lubricus]PTQ91097.1 O-antigen/teichoic acid export membrane protein [Agitococcus lubricus]